MELVGELQPKSELKGPTQFVPEVRAKRVDPKVNESLLILNTCGFDLI